MDKKDGDSEFVENATAIDEVRAICSFQGPGAEEIKKLEKTCKFPLGSVKARNQAHRL